MYNREETGKHIKPMYKVSPSIARILIARYLKIHNSNITRCEQWDRVWFVVVKGLGSRFISKSVVKYSSVDVQVLQRPHSDFYCLRLLITESVRRFNNNGNRKLSRDSVTDFIAVNQNHEHINQAYLRVESACKVLTEAGVCTADNGFYLLTDAGIKYGQMLIS